DRVGLHVGDPESRITAGLLCIDLTEAVLDEAIHKRVNLVVAYHPPIFKPLTALTTLDPKQRVIYRAAKHGIAIYSPHTALDAAPGGVNDWLASGLGDGQVQPIKRSAPAEGSGFKLVTFVPTASVDRVREAVCRAGAGRIGDYELCTFTSEGVGTFRGGAGTNPVIGRPGRLEQVGRRRKEVVVPRSKLSEVVSALRASHPYEEPAFDVYPLQPVADTDTGQGRVVTLDRPIALSTLVRRIKAHLKAKTLEVADAGSRRIRRVGLCAGAGGSLLDEAGPIDAFFTGEMRHHDVLAAVNRGISVVLAGHTQTERPYLPVYRRRLEKATGRAIQWAVSRADKAPSSVV
ncbi:MAG: Nif3-like dinuclear metal center hexameric protein, partial [Bacteroidetes bacterium]